MKISTNLVPQTFSQHKTNHSRTLLLKSQLEQKIIYLQNCTILYYYTRFTELCEWFAFVLEATLYSPSGGSLHEVLGLLQDHSRLLLGLLESFLSFFDQFLSLRRVLSSSSSRTVSLNKSNLKSYFRTKLPVDLYSPWLPLRIYPQDREMAQLQYGLL